MTPGLVDCLAHDRGGLVLGVTHRRAHEALARLQASAPAARVADIVRAVVAAPALRPATAQILIGRGLPAEELESIVSALGDPDRWPPECRLQLAAWIANHGFAPGAWAELELGFPTRDGLPLLPGQLRRARWPESPACLHATRSGLLFEWPPEAVAPKERLAEATLAWLAVTDPFEGAAPLARRAADFGLQAFLAHVLEQGGLCARAWDDDVVSAFHALDWERYGVFKLEFLADAPDPIGLGPGGPDRERMAGLWQYSRGRHRQGAEMLERAMGNPAGPAAIREMVVALIDAGFGPGTIRPWLDRLPATGATLRARLELLAQLAGFGSRDAETAVTRMLAEGLLPARTDPLFAALVLAVHRNAHAALRARPAWGSFLAHLDHQEPRWRELLPRRERGYLDVRVALERSDRPPDEIAEVVRGLLLVPVEPAWLRECMVALDAQAFRPLMTTTAGDPSAFGLVIRGLCTRAIEYVQAAGDDIPAPTRLALLRSDPRPVLTATIEVLARHSKSRR